MVKDILQEEGLTLKEKANFIPHRPMKVRFREMSNESAAVSLRKIPHTAESSAAAKLSPKVKLLMP